MNRREFALTSAGLLATLAAPGVWAVDAPESRRRQFSFRPFRAGNPAAPVTVVTPPDGNYVFTYFNVCPWSPSGRFLFATRLPYQDHDAVHGDAAEACVIDLQEQTIETIYRTRCWGFQTGANLHWGATDDRLYTNDIIGGVAVCVRVDLRTRRTRAFAGPGYDIAPDESCAIGFPLELMDATQKGYGAPSPDPAHPRRLPPGAARDEGIWRTDLKTNEKRLLVSLAAVAARVKEPPPLPGGTWYFWHAKHNRQGTRILQVLRHVFPGDEGSRERNPMVFTYAPDGGDIRSIEHGPVWRQRGGHPAWHCDGRHVTRNMDIAGQTRLCQWQGDGSGFRVLSEKLVSGGHPTVEPRGRFAITDHIEHAAASTVTLRLLDLAGHTELAVCRAPTIRVPPKGDATLRLDGHPVWSRDHRQCCLQGAPDGHRQLLIADLSRFVA
jgi:hypothetical protein